MQEGIDFLYCNICFSQTGESKQWETVGGHLKKHHITSKEYQEMFQNCPLHSLKILPNITRKDLSINKKRYKERFSGKENINYIICQICKQTHNQAINRHYNIPYYKRRFHYLKQHLKRYHHLSEKEIKEYESKYSTIASNYHNARSKLTKKNFNTTKLLQERQLKMIIDNPMNDPNIVKKVSLGVKKHYTTEKGKLHKEKTRLSNMTNKERANKISVTKTDWDFYNEHGTTRANFPYDIKFNKERKESIAKRDYYTCQLCKTKYPFPYHVHHIDYDKMNTESINLIYLCGSCHSKTNYNREFWQAYFTKYQKERLLLIKT